MIRRRISYRADAAEAARAVLAGFEVRLAPDTPQPKKTLTYAPLLKEAGPNGRNLCRWCHTEVPKGRRKWCSDACVHEFKVITDWNYMRRRVRKRDKGVCCQCGVDTAKAREKWLRIRGRYVVSIPQWREVYEALVELTWPTDLTRDWWEADHIHARADGGTNHLENLRTLCVPCHKSRTKKQAAERAARKRDKRKALVKMRARYTTRRPRV